MKSLLQIKTDTVVLHRIMFIKLPQMPGVLQSLFDKSLHNYYLGVSLHCN